MRLLPVEVSPPKLDLTIHAYMRHARLAQKGRLRLIFQHLNDHRPLAELAVEAGISLRCATKWLARYRAGGPPSLADRRSIRRQQRLHELLCRTTW